MYVLLTHLQLVHSLLPSLLRQPLPQQHLLLRLRSLPCRMAVMAMPMISHSKLCDACLPTVCLTITIQSEQSFRPCVIGLLTLSNYNGDENDNENENENGDDNDNENDNENDLPWAMCFCAYRRAAYGIVSYLLLTPLPLSPLNSSYPYLLFFS